MPRRVDKKCVACAQLSASDARQLHGEEGDKCWNERRCPRRRSHYRNRQQLNEKRRLQYRQLAAEASPGAGRVERVSLPIGGVSSGERQVERVTLPIEGPSKPYANLYIWREKRKDAPLHAIAATVFQDGSKVLEVVPIHCAEYRKSQIRRYVHEKVLGYLK
ncbi:MAG: hypothetical protein AAGL17_23880, partial [Cyanobacteria bacterium J06576_12]